MLLRRGSSRSHEIDRQLACLLAGVAGALNTAAFHTVGFFSANMTGNASAFSDRAASGQWLPGFFYLGIVLVFILGASVSTVLIHAGQRRHVHDIYAIAILVEAMLMALLGLFEWRVPSLHRGAVLILCLAFMMGIQNAVVTLISDARVRTTHISGMSTDIGIEIGMLIDLMLRRPVAADATACRAKLRLHVLTVLSFVVGGVAGVLIYRAIGNALLFVASALLFTVSAWTIVRARTWAGQDLTRKS